MDSMSDKRDSSPEDDGSPLDDNEQKNSAAQSKRESIGYSDTAHPSSDIPTMTRADMVDLITQVHA
jgi:hypothetical protein